MCVAKPLTERVLQHYRHTYPSLRILHLADEYRASRCDSVWISRLSTEGGWVVLTSDMGRHSTFGKTKKPKLPDLCREYSVTSVTMTAGLAKQGSKMHMEAMHEVLRNCDPIYRAPAAMLLSIRSARAVSGE